MSNKTASRAWRRTVIWVAAGLAGVGLSTQPAAQRVIERPLMPTADGSPSTLDFPQEVVSAVLVWRIGATGTTPTGFEGHRGAVNRRPSAFRRLPIEGMTVGDALQNLIAGDPRYAWHEHNGVVVVRPVSAWSDKDNPLNQPTGHIDWSEISTEEALKRIFNIVYGYPPSSLAPMSARPDRTVSIRIESGTVIDLLNALVQADGEMTWSATYPEDEPRIRFRLNLNRFSGFDGHGIGSPRLPPSLNENPLRPDN
jgi:hypothetical protein